MFGGDATRAAGLGWHESTPLALAERSIINAFAPEVSSHRFLMSLKTVNTLIPDGDDCAFKKRPTRSVWLSDMDSNHE